MSDFIAINADKPRRWKEDIAASVDQYNQWFINFAPLQNACASLQQSARAFEEARSQAQEHNHTLTSDTTTQLDHTLAGLEQLLTASDGLPRRPWYQHLIYAPGFYTGYAVKTLPGVREALEQRNWTEAGEQIQRAASAIEKYAAELKQAAELFKGNGVAQ